MEDSSSTEEPRSAARRRRRRMLELRRRGASADPKRSREEEDEEDWERGFSSSSSGGGGSSSYSSSGSDSPPSVLAIVAGAVDEGELGALANPHAPSVSHGSVSVIGKRREMEDAVTVALGFLAAHDFFGVYDGHGGAEVAKACRERMHVVLAAEVERRMKGAAGGGGGGNGCWWREAMEACFERVDGEVAVKAKGGAGAEKTVGSTAVVAVVGKGRIVVANCGDSRAVLCRDGVAVPLSSDHKPNRPDEMERVEAAGGRVINWDGYRVLGVLATSRSIGDQYLKPFVTSEPEVTVTDRAESDEFLILASDGLWDVISNEAACSVTRQCLAGRIAGKSLGILKGRRRAALAAAALAELAMSRGSRDNISVVVVELARMSGGGSYQNGRHRSRAK